MRLLLDTCTFLWLATDQTRVSSAALAAIKDANNALFLSVISVIETHRLLRKGKLSLQGGLSLDGWFRSELLQHRVQIEPITLEIAHVAETLPAIHNDPADRLIVATAHVLGATVLTPDATISTYPNIAVLW